MKEIEGEKKSVRIDYDVWKSIQQAKVDTGKEVYVLVRDAWAAYSAPPEVPVAGAPVLPAHQQWIVDGLARMLADTARNEQCDLFLRYVTEVMRRYLEKSS